MIKKKGAFWHQRQHTMKILLNSLYGATALGSFRYGNVILSEAITLSGQRIIQESALCANRHMNKVIKKSNTTMSLKPQSIRNNAKILWNGEPITKQEIIDMSALWSEKQIVYFKKMVKQGGTFKN